MDGGSAEIAGANFLASGMMHQIKIFNSLMTANGQ